MLGVSILEWICQEYHIPNTRTPRSIIIDPKCHQNGISPQNHKDPRINFVLTKLLKVSILISLMFHCAVQTWWAGGGDHLGCSPWQTLQDLLSPAQGRCADEDTLMTFSLRVPKKITAYKLRGSSTIKSLEHSISVFHLEAYKSYHFIAFTNDVDNIVAQ